MSGASVLLEHVTLARGDRVVVSDVTLAIHRGEFIGVFGPNGAGKTTFLHALLGLLQPAAGTITVNGHAPSRGSPTIGYLPQSRATVRDLRLQGRELVAAALDGERFGLPFRSRAAWSIVDAALDEVNARSLASRRVGELSGGELQRLYLAQALLGSPPLILLDEPLIALDPHFQAATVALAKEIQRRRHATILFTAHDVNALVGAMDRVMYFGHGRATLGTVDEVINRDVLSAMYGTPIDVVRIDHRIVVLAERGVIEAGAHHHA